LFTFLRETLTDGKVKKRRGKKKRAGIRREAVALK
jgi:hypothetical protein